METASNDQACTWATRFLGMPLPVLRETKVAIARAALDPDSADAHGLAERVLRDPLMCARVLAHASRAWPGRLRTPVDTVTGALVLMGVEPFFAVFGDLPVLEET